MFAGRLTGPEHAKFNPYEKTFGTGNFGFCGRV